MSDRPDPLTWRLAWRTALVASVVLTTLGAALFRFAAVEPTWLVFGAGVIGLWIGSRLPALPTRRTRVHL